MLVHRDFMSTPASGEQECSKLAPQWFGPFEVTDDILSERTVRVKLPSVRRVHPVFNVAALNHYHEDDSFGNERPLQLRLLTWIGMRDTLFSPSSTNWK